jgi:hypothetical protein
MRLQPASVLLLALAIISSHTARGSGPLLVAGGKPVLWSFGDGQHPVSYQVDRGPVGPLDEKAAREHVQAAFDVWTKVETASIPAFSAGLLTNDVQSGKEYLALKQDPASGNIVVFDNDGSIIDDLSGMGNSAYILGWALPFTKDGFIVRFVSLFNGSLIDPSDLREFRLTLIHEFGHALGLDHSQIQWEVAGDGNAANDVFVPTMYPTSSDGAKFRKDLHADDVAWISKLYPKAGKFAKSHGTVCGKLVHANGNPVLGSNVVAIRSDIPNIRFSATSDWLKGHDGSFEMSVPPGDYTIKVEAIRPSFVAGSSVGQYALDSQDVAFSHSIGTKSFGAAIHVKAGNRDEVGILNCPNPPQNAK